jgi:hypothetical protein
MVASGSSTEVTTSVYSGHTGHKETEQRETESRSTSNAPVDIVSEKPGAVDNVHAAVVETVVDEKAAKEDVKTEAHDDDSEYPEKWRLGLITIALCLSVFCMALVGPPSVCVVPI